MYTACTWRGPISPKPRSCISEMKNLCLYWVMGQCNSEALFRNLFHDLYACSSQSSDRDTGCWGFWIYKIMTHDSPTDSRESRYGDPAFLNTLLHSTTWKPRTPKHKEAIEHHCGLQHPRKPRPPTLQDRQTARHDANWWPARPRCTEGTGWRMVDWRELSRSTITNLATELHIAYM